nr:hypothetical protein [Angustibacter aerolatus]
MSTTDLTAEERAADLDLQQPAAARRPRRVRPGEGPVPRHRLGRAGLRLRQRHPGRALLPDGVRHGARRLQRPRDRQPRPQGVRAEERVDPLRAEGRRGPRQPAARPPPPARGRRRRHLPRGAGRRPLRRARPIGRRDDRRGAARRHRRARHGAHRGDPGVRRHGALAGAAHVVRRPVPARLRRPPGHVREARRRPEAAVPGARPRRRQRRAWARWTSGSPSTTR